MRSSTRCVAASAGPSRSSRTSPSGRSASTPILTRSSPAATCRRTCKTPSGPCPEDFRAAVVLCDVVGLDYAEIGDSLGIPAGTVRSRIHRGRAQLRKALVS